MCIIISNICVLKLLIYVYFLIFKEISITIFNIQYLTQSCVFFVLRNILLNFF